MERMSLVELKERLHAQGFEQKAIVSDEEMELAQESFNSQEDVMDTPAEELRYIEGLPNLPFGHIEEFKILPAKGSESCACGRIPSALDVVYTALNKRIHDREVIRDTLIGFSNLIELSENGRTAECYNCGLISSRSYWTRRYMYA